MNLALPELARQNYAALCTLSAFFERRGYWPADRLVSRETPLSVLQLFEVLAWADDRLHLNECWLLDALLEEDDVQGGQLRSAIEEGQAPGPEPRIPGALAAAALHDSIHGTRFAEMVIKHLENLAFLFVMADSKVSPTEQDALDAYFGHLRGSIVTTQRVATNIP